MRFAGGPSLLKCSVRSTAVGRVVSAAPRRWLLALVVPECAPGLGLYICEQILRDHGGTIDVESTSESTRVPGKAPELRAVGLIAVRLIAPGAVGELACSE